MNGGRCERNVVGDTMPHIIVWWFCEGNCANDFNIIAELFRDYRFAHIPQHFSATHLKNCIFSKIKQIPGYQLYTITNENQQRHENQKEGEKWMFEDGRFHIGRYRTKWQKHSTWHVLFLPAFLSLLTRIPVTITLLPLEDSKNYSILTLFGVA